MTLAHDCLPEFSRQPEATQNAEVVVQVVHIPIINLSRIQTLRILNKEDRTEPLHARILQYILEW